MAGGLRDFRPVEYRPTPTEHARTRCAVWTWRGCVVGQEYGERLSPRRRPGLNRTNTATSQQHGHRTAVPIAPESRGARLARFSPRGISADQPQSTRCAVRTWPGCVVGQYGERSSSRRRPGLNRTNTATGREHGRRTAVLIASESRGARPARFSPRIISVDRPQSTFCAVQTWGSCVVG